MTPGERLQALVNSGQLVCDAVDVAVVLGMSTWSVQEAVRESALPIQPIRVGKRRYKFRVADLAALVGVQ